MSYFLLKIFFCIGIIAGAIQNAQAEGETSTAPPAALKANPALDVGSIQVPQITLTGKNLIEIPDIVCQVDNLSSINLANNEITNFDGNCASNWGANLIYLELNDNKLSSLPATIYTLTSLETLEVKNNIISRLPSQIGRLNSLTRLRLSSNKIHQGDLNYLANLTSLQVLDLANNGLTEIPISLGKLQRIKNLDLSGNSLTKVPGFIAYLLNLSRLNLSNNPISNGEIAALKAIMAFRPSVSVAYPAPQP